MKKVIFLISVLIIVVFVFAPVNFWGVVLFLLGIILGISISKIYPIRREKIRFLSPDRDLNFKK